MKGKGKVWNGFTDVCLSGKQNHATMATMNCNEEERCEKYCHQTTSAEVQDTSVLEHHGVLANGSE